MRLGRDTTQNSPLIRLIENYVPEAGSNILSTNFFSNSQNLITNPQFADISFASPVTFSSAGVYNIAPGWQLTLTGSGTSVVTQIALPGSDNLPNNPPYSLQIYNTGWSTAFLTETFNNNGSIFAGGSIAVSFLAKTSTSPYNPVITYVPNIGASTSIPGLGSTVTGVYTSIGGAVNLPASTNTNSNGAANVQLMITIPTDDIINITNVQFLGQSIVLPNGETSLPVGSIPQFIEQSYEQIVNQEFHNYRDSIINHPKNSLLTGWNFANNPWQFITTTSTNLATNSYTADQTIVIQQNYVTNATGNNVAIGRASDANNRGFQVTAVGAHNNFAILQYISPLTAKGYWGQVVSSMVTAFLSTAHATSISFKMRLIYRAGLPNDVAQNDPIVSWVEGADPVAASGYFLIAPPNDPVYTLTTSPAQFAFNNLILPAASTANMTLGILIYTISNMNQNATADAIIFNDVSLVQNKFALPTQPETYDETLRKCRFYYEKSYSMTTLPGTSTDNGALIFKCTCFFDGTNSFSYGSTFGFPFKETKCQLPTMTFYSPANGSSGQINTGLQRNGVFISGQSGNTAVSNWSFTISDDALIADFSHTDTSQYEDNTGRSW